ncbi:Na+/H+ antiporter subunit A [Kocuria coralli]|uniref:Na+/H+ antiporter subunit A n=1 Tax=Kocuria coralli TaxID=1461025 RepID=A0A5J5L084_9MICC|nr:Na+/H+ antiporter subunit A [Kocuria coralli]KAA9395359.1 Na+/H+ antiporter subunit A [Kocuria coralli]
MLAVLIAHALAALLAPVIFPRIGRNAFYLLAAVPAASFVWLLLQWPAVDAGDDPTRIIPWVPGLDLELAFRMDALAWATSLLVLGVGSLVLAYCARYFSKDSPDMGSFGSQLVAFAGVMFGLVTSDDLMLMFIFWEITSVLSFLLIGYARARLSARRAAMQALVITTAGGLTMLVGVVMLGQLGGTYRISELLAGAPQIIEAHEAMISVAIALILVGAVTKSALVPFHFWLPAAMAAPTPVSAYLHAAAMVKAGVFIVARFAPAYAETAAWQPMTLILGLATMLFGGWVALRQYDLKLILAYGTVSQLGFLILVLGQGTADAALGGLALMLAHGCFKATLFLVVGIIDHQTGTRDIRKLSGLHRPMRGLFVISFVGAASMSGVPLLGGFVAKEAVLEGLLHAGEVDGDPASWIRLIGVVIGSILTVAYSARFVWGAFAGKRTEFADLPVGSDGRPVRTPTHGVSWAFQAPAAVLTVVTIAYGLYPGPVETILTPWVRTFGTETSTYLSWWHGLTPALGLSATVLLLGLVLFWLRGPVTEFQRSLPRLPAGERVYRGVIDQLDRLAVKVTGSTQRGSLGFYLSVILVTAIVVPVIALFIQETPPLGPMRIADSWGQVIAGAIMVVAAIAVIKVQKRFLAVLLVSVTGFGMVLIFALQGAPDLALTQMLVETIALVAIVLALRSLPAPVWDRQRGKSRWPQAVVAVTFGAFMMLLAAFSMASRTASPISLNMPEMAYELGNGANVVNVILVDIRAWDTFGELTVVVVAATGVASLLFVQGRGDRLVRRAVAPDTAQLEKIQSRASQALGSESYRSTRKFQVEPSTPYILAGKTVAPEIRSIILEVITRLLFHTIMLVSLYLLIAGHNSPGGGFAGGLTAGLALTLRYLAGGRYELERATPVNAGTMLGLGLAICCVYAVVPVFFGGSIMQSYTLGAELPLYGYTYMVTSVIFDVGVYFIVIGLVLDILRSLGGYVDEQHEEEIVRRRRRAQGRGARIKVRRGPAVDAGTTTSITVTREEPDEADEEEPAR